MERETKIYVLRDPRTNEVRYVGKTVKSLSARLSGHIFSSKSARTHRDKWIASLMAHGVRPTIELIEVAFENWAAREAFWISHYRSDRLTNHTDGGEGVCGLVHTDKFRHEQSLRTKVAMTPERRVMHSQAMKRVAANPDWVASQVAGLKRRALDPAWCEKQAEKTRATMTPERLAEMSRITKAAMTLERRAEHSRKLKVTTSDPQWRARQSAAIKATMTPERRAAISAAVKASMTPERRAAISAQMKALHAEKAAQREGNTP